MSWTEERVALLTRLWNEGQSASQIAKELGGVTRNAVIGKVHRLGMSKPSGDSAKATAAAPVTPPVEAAPETPSAEEAPVETVEEPVVAAPSEPEPEPVETPEPVPEPTPEAEEASPAETLPAVPAPPRTPQDFRALIAAGRPLPPQPSANEIPAEALARVTEVERSAKRLSLMELTERTCKWPIGDPATQEFWFCGLPSQQGKPYCEAHVGVAFQPMSSRRDRRR